MPLPDTTSATQLSTYADCPRKYRYRYLDHAEPEYKAVGLALGSAVHSSIGWYYERRRDGKAPSISEVMSITGADLTAALAECVNDLVAENSSEPGAHGRFSLEAVASLQC